MEREFESHSRTNSPKRKESKTHLNETEMDG